MRMIMIAGCLAAVLGGCQTAQESMADAEVTCEAQGFRPGTAAYNRCRAANYQENRRVSNETSAAVATGVAAGVVGGAIIGASARGPYYGRGYYRRGGYWW